MRHCDRLPRRFSVVSGLPIGLVITFDILAGGPVIAR
jgi:hypothetical protein